MAKRSMEHDVIIISDTLKYKTSLCDLWLEDNEGNMVPFDIIKSKVDNHDYWVDESGESIEVTDNIQYGIRISTNLLDIKKKYYFSFSEPLEFSCSDERIFTLSRRTDGAVFAVSFPDPNDLQKPFNAGPEGYDWYDFTFYYTDPYRCVLRIFDYQKQFIYVSFAVLWNIKDHYDDYASIADELTAWVWV